MKQINLSSFIQVFLALVLAFIAETSIIAGGDLYSGHFSKEAVLAHVQGKILLENATSFDAYTKACDQFKISASNNYPSAQIDLGECFRTGKGRLKDLEKALEWYRIARDNGSIHASYMIGATYLFEYGDENYYQEGFNELIRARKNGHQNASFSIGIAYYLGRGTERDFHNAIQAYVDAAKTDNVYAQAILYEIYSKGLYGEQPDPQLAEEWKIKVENNPNRYNRNSWTIYEALATLYAKGWGLPQDDAIASQLRAKIKQ